MSLQIIMSLNEFCLIYNEVSSQNRTLASTNFKTDKYFKKSKLHLNPKDVRIEVFMDEDDSYIFIFNLHNGNVILNEYELIPVKKKKNQLYLVEILIEGFISRLGSEDISFLGKSLEPVTYSE